MMNDPLIEDEIWEALYTTSAPDVPFDAMSELIQKCKESVEVEDELIEEFEAILDDKEEEWEEDFYWIMVILAKAGSQKSIPLFLRCLSRFPDYDDVLEVVHQCLIWMGEPAVREAMSWMKHKRSFVEKLYVAGVFENVLDYGDENLLADVKQFLKDQVAIEEEIGDESDCLSQYLMALAYFPGEDVLPFVRLVVSKFDYHPELNDAFEVAEGRFSIERDNEYARDWKEFCRSYAELMDPELEKKSQDLQKSWENLLQESKKAFEAEDWHKLIELGKTLKQERFFRANIAPMLCGAYLNLEMKEEFEAEVKEALDWVDQSWKLFPKRIDYKKDIEAFEILRIGCKFATAEEHLFLTTRFGDYMLGLLHNLGFTKYDTAIKKIKRLINQPDSVSDDVLRQFFETQTEVFVFRDPYIALTSVEDLGLLIQEFEKREIPQIFPESLTNIKLMQEGRMHGLYTKEEKVLDQKIRIFTLGRWNLELFRQAMRNDITEFVHRDRLLEKMRMYFENFPNLVECMLEAWNISPRWELGGRAPRDLNSKGRLSRQPDQTSEKIGRNEPCPCGSGKKYKKCCGG